MLAKKVEMLNKAMEVESKKMRREVAAMEKEVVAMRTGKEQDHRNGRPSATRGAVVVSHTHSIRCVSNHSQIAMLLLNYNSFFYGQLISHQTTPTLLLIREHIEKLFR